MVKGRCTSKVKTNIFKISSLSRSRLGANFALLIFLNGSSQTHSLLKTCLERYMLLEEGEIAILSLCPGSLQKEGAGIWPSFFSVPSVSASINQICLQGKKTPTNPNLSMEWNEAGRVCCGIQHQLIKMQCFQQLLASSVFPGFLFHTLLSFFFLVLSPSLRVLFPPSVASCAPSALCCVYPGLNPVGFERQVCLQVLASVLTPVFWGAAPVLFLGQCWRCGFMQRSSYITGWARANSHYPWEWRAQCPSPALVASSVQGLLMFFFCQLSR